MKRNSVTGAKPSCPIHKTHLHFPMTNGPNICFTGITPKVISQNVGITTADAANGLTRFAILSPINSKLPTRPAHRALLLPEVPSDILLPSECRGGALRRRRSARESRCDHRRQTG